MILGFGSATSSSCSSSPSTRRWTMSTTSTGLAPRKENFERVPTPAHTHAQTIKGVPSYMPLTRCRLPWSRLGLRVARPSHGSRHQLWGYYRPPGVRRLNRVVVPALLLRVLHPVSCCRPSPTSVRVLLWIVAHRTGVHSTTIMAFCLAGRVTPTRLHLHRLQSQWLATTRTAPQRSLSHPQLLWHHQSTATRRLPCLCRRYQGR